MASMSDGVEVETKARGGVLSGLKRSVLGGTTFFINTFRAANGGEVGVAPDLPGDITVIPVDASQPVLVQSGSWLAGDSSVDIDTKWGGSKTFFSGKGLFLLRCTGAGDILAASYGAILARTLAAGETFTLDTGFVVAFDESVQFDVHKAGNWKTTILGGEGLVTKFTGPGRLWMQTRSPQDLIGWIVPQIPTQSELSESSSGVPGDRVLGRAHIAATELDRVHHERRDLVERHAVGPSRCERRDLLVGVEGGRTETAEEPHHRQIELAMTAVRGGIHQPVPPVGGPEAVPRPQVAVQPRRRLVGASELAETRRDPTHAVDGGGRQRVRVACEARERHQPLRSRRTRTTSRSARSAVPGSRSSDGRPARSRAPRPRAVGPGRRRSAARRPRRRAIRAAISIHSRTRWLGASSETASTSGTAIGPSAVSPSRSHRSPAASVLKKWAGALGCVLANTVRPSARSTA